MSESTTSIFDLSPAEKLQLVEDLWDDLASSPEDIPVHDWQIEEPDFEYSSSTDPYEIWPEMFRFWVTGELDTERSSDRQDFMNEYMSYILSLDIWNTNKKPD